MRKKAISILIAVVLGSMILGPAPAASDSALAKDCPAAEGQYVHIARQLRQDVLTLTNNPHEPAALVVNIGRNPEEISRAIAEEIFWHPELGVVRGPAGTLSSGTGGDWDRAVLLQAGLEAAGYPTRLVVAERTEQQRQQVVEEFLAAGGGGSLTMHPETSRQDSEPPDTGLLERYGVPVQNHTVLMAEASARWRRLLDEAYDSGDRMADGISGRLKNPQIGQAVAFDYSAWLQRMKDASSETVAVEVQTGDGWVLMKPGPDADRIDWSHGRRIAKAPPGRTARMNLGIEMTVRDKDDSITRSMLIDHSMELHQLFRRPISLEIAPEAGEGGQASPGSWTAGQWYERVQNFDRFQVILKVGQEMFSSLVFDMSGYTYKVGRDGRIEGAKSVGSAVQKGFGLASGGPDDTAKDEDSSLETIVLTMEIERPGLETIRQRRLVYGPLRPAATPVFHADILAAGGPVSPVSVLWMALDAATANAGFLAQALKAAGPDKYPVSSPARMPEMLHEWFLARSELAGRMLFSNPDLALISGPAVSMQSTQLLIDDEDTQVRARTALDVICNDTKLGPRKPADAAAALQANLSLGIASTTFEALLLREQIPPETISTALTASELLFYNQTNEGSGKQELSPIAAWGIENNETGRSVYFCGPGPVNTWWSIDPKTGATIGRGDGAEGQAAAEYGNLQKQNLNNLKCFLEAFGGGSGEDYVLCMTGLDSSTGRMGAGVGLRTQLGGFDEQGEVLSLFSQAWSAMECLDKAGIIGKED
ncbi:MAG: hypothetical protein ACLFUN_07340 [Desulfobacterales bacterium]